MARTQKLTVVNDVEPEAGGPVDWSARLDELTASLHAIAAEQDRVAQERAGLVLARAAGDPQAEDALKRVHQQAAELREQAVDIEAAIAVARLRREEAVRAGEERFKQEARLAVEIVGANRRQLAAEIDAWLAILEALYREWRSHARAANLLARRAGYLGETDALSDGVDVAAFRDAVHRVAPEVAAALDVPGHVPGIDSSHLHPLRVSEQHRTAIVHERLAAVVAKERRVAEEAAVTREQQAAETAARRGAAAA